MNEMDSCIAPIEIARQDATSISFVGKSKSSTLVVHVF